MTSGFRGLGFPSRLSSGARSSREARMTSGIAPAVTSRSGSRSRSADEVARSIGFPAEFVRLSRHEVGRGHLERDQTRLYRRATRLCIALSPASTRKSSCSASQWYISFGAPGEMTSSHPEHREIRLGLDLVRTRDHPWLTGTRPGVVELNLANHGPMIRGEVEAS